MFLDFWDSIHQVWRKLPGKNREWSIINHMKNHEERHKMKELRAEEHVSPADAKYFAYFKKF